MSRSVDVAVPCARVGCWSTFTVSLSRGRPRRFCSDDCRKRAGTDKKRCLARIAALEDALRRERHLLAAMGDDSEVEEVES